MYLYEMISILMPIYNGVEFINDSVNSIKLQTYKDWELIIGINGHPPNSETYKKAKKYETKEEMENGNYKETQRIRVLDMHEIKGKSEALNKMMEFVKNDWVALLDVDDVWLPQKLESQIPYMKEYDVIGTMCKYFGDMNIVPNIPVGDISKFNFLRVNPIINSSCLVRRELCYWDGNWDGVEDYDMWLRLRNNNHKFFNVGYIHVLHRIHNDSAFNSKGNNLNVNKLIKKHNII